jgi:hypothetical protein
MAKDNRRISEELMQGVLIDDPTFLKEIVERMLQELLEGEMTRHLGAGPYGERTSTGTGGDRFSELTDPACRTEPSRGGGATLGGNGSNRRPGGRKALHQPAYRQFAPVLDPR